MHGLVFCTVEAFVTDCFGPDAWDRAIFASQVDVMSFEAMLNYDDGLLPDILGGCADVLTRDVAVLLEDIGTYLVTCERRAFVRRLMRFGGGTFAELLQSLDELPGRIRLAVPGLELPDVRVREHGQNRFTITCTDVPRGFAHVLVGLLRAMADDYGTLAMLEHLGARDGLEIVEAKIFDPSFAMDKGFSLARDADPVIP